MTEAKEFNLEEFTKDYIAAVRDNDSEKIISLLDMTELETKENKEAALVAILKAVEEDQELAEANKELIAVLQGIQEANRLMEEAAKATAEEAESK